MTAAQFNMLAENIDDVGFLQPILVVPIADGKFRIVDGEHRYEQQRLNDVEIVRCVVADPARFDEDTQKFQTLRMNKIHGQMNQSKFNSLVKSLMDSGDHTYDELAHNFGFTDEDEFMSLLDTTRDSLPTPEMKKEFDNARDEIKTVDDLSMLLNRLFSEFGDTLPGNFMLLDFGGKEHVWVRVPKGKLKDIVKVARTCMGKGVTFDSVICQLLLSADIPRFIQAKREALDDVVEEPHVGSIDNMLGDTDE